MTCKWSVNLFTSPNPVYNHTHTTLQYKYAYVSYQILRNISALNFGNFQFLTESEVSKLNSVSGHRLKLQDSNYNLNKHDMNVTLKLQTKLLLLRGGD
jgi:hypothetical protein